MTPSRWTLFAPWWARWLLGVVVTAGTFAAVTALMLPAFRSPADWPGKAAVVAGFGAAFAAMIDYAQQPMRRAYLTALDGLDRSQRALALTALRRGEAPTDPAVLAGAIRAGAVSKPRPNGPRKSQKAVRYWLPAVYLVLAVVDLLTHTPRQGLLWLGFAVFFALYFASVSHREQRLQRQVACLHTAAGGVPEAQAALSETARGGPLRSRRIWVPVVMVVVLFACFGATEYFWGSPTLFSSSPRGRACATASEVVEYLNRHHDILDAQLIVPGGRDLNAYQDWSDQLRTFAQQVTHHDLAPHLQRISDLSAHAVAVVRDLRQSASAAANPDLVKAHENDYTHTMSDIVHESGAVTSTCTGH